MNSTSPDNGAPERTGLDYLFVLMWIVLLLVVLIMLYLTTLSAVVMGTDLALVVVWNLFCSAILVYLLIHSARLNQQRRRGEPVAFSKAWLFVLGLPLLTLFIWSGGCVVSNPRLFQ